MSMSVPTFVLAGAARAGSTAVMESLRSSPGVFVTQPKEPHFLALAGIGAHFTGPDDDTTINRVAVTEERDYLDLFRHRGDCVAAGEGSVSTLYYHQEAVPRLRRLNPEVKIIVLLREPVSRAYSSHQYLTNRGSEQVTDFLEAVELEPQRRQAGWHHLWHYTSMSMYADATEHLLQAFGSEQVRVWWYDELADDPLRCLSEIHEFVGVTSPAPTALVGQRVNASGAPRRRWLQSAMHGAAKHSAVRAGVRAVVPFSVRERIRNANLSRQDLPADVRAALAPRFASDLQKLQSVLGRAVPPTWS